MGKAGRHQGQWKTLAHIAILTVAGPAHGQALVSGDQCECSMAAERVTELNFIFTKHFFQTEEEFF